MQSQNVSSSSLSDASEIRYQKAVREISKLIGNNNSIKKDADNYRIMCQNLQFQNQQLFRGYEELTNQKKLLVQKIRKYEEKINQLQQSHKELLKKQENQLSKSLLQEERKKHFEQLQIFNDKLNEQGHTMMVQQDFLAQLQKENKDLKEFKEKLQNEIQKLIEQKTKKINFNQCIKCPQTIKKMNDAYQWRTKMQQQNVDLRKRLVYYESPNRQNVFFDSKKYFNNELVLKLQDDIRYKNQKIARYKREQIRTTIKIEKLQFQIQHLKRNMKQKNEEMNGVLMGQNYKFK